MSGLLRRRMVQWHTKLNKVTTEPNPFELNQSSLCRRVLLSRSCRLFCARRRMPEEENTLTMAVRHVAEARRMVAEQQERIARLRAAGASTRDAEQSLDVFQSTLSLLEEHERMCQSIGLLH